MMLTAALFAAAMGAADPAEAAPRELRIPVGDLDLSRTDHSQRLAERVAERSGAFCAEHLAWLTPQHMGDPRFCRREIARDAVNALPAAQRAEFVRSGGQRRLNVLLARRA